MSNIFRTSFLASLLMLACTIAFLFVMKYKVQNINKQIINLNSSIIREKETIHILHAEWAYLTQPNRISKLANKHLLLQAIPANRLKLLSLDSVTSEEK